MTNKQRIVASNSALESVKDILPAEFYREVSDYINKYNEWGIGIESLIDYLCEEKSKVTPDQFCRVREAMESMGLCESDRLKELSDYVAST